MLNSLAKPIFLWYTYLMMNKKHFILATLYLSLLSLQGCGYIGDFFEELFDPNLLIIRGTKTYSGKDNSLTINPGTTVRFKANYSFGILGQVMTDAEMIFSDGAYLIADGEAGRQL